MKAAYLKGVVYLRNMIGIRFLDDSDDEEKIIEALRAMPLLNGVPESDIRKLHERSQITVRSRGEVLFSEGENLESCFLILRGWIKLFRETQDGEESVVDLLSRGDILGETALHGASMTFGAQVIGGSAAVCEVPLALVREFLRGNERFSSQFLTYLMRQSMRLRLHVEQLSVMSAIQRVAYFLHSLHQKNGKVFQLPCDKSLIAEYLGMKPETFSRALTELKENGVKIQGTQVIMSDPALLSGYLPVNNNEPEQKHFAA